VLPGGERPGGTVEKKARGDAVCSNHAQQLPREEHLRIESISKSTRSTSTLAELARTVTRLKEQLRGIEIEHRSAGYQSESGRGTRRSDFDPLELERYSSYSSTRSALAETSGDVAAFRDCSKQ